METLIAVIMGGGGAFLCLPVIMWIADRVANW